MNWVTILILLVVGLLTWRAWRNGFIKELVSLASVILAIPLAGIFYDDLFPKVEPIIDNRTLAGLVSFLAIVGGVIVGGQVAAYLLRRSVEMLNLGAADQLAGAAFGFLKAILVIQVVLIAFVRFPKPDLREDIDNSAAAQLLLEGTPFVLTILPGSFDRAVDLFQEGLDAINGNEPGGEETAPAD